ncbi:UDP-N-acetylmuramoyl-L-alanyl-D-glutamate--2,6-diaminopimelate ligase [Helicobacter monodelphidis]|uniref:UDP-N-acetylmuramoyl-L-alanyl-D-glutamate--2, 6-diaminopimelate ligase n=1 Tax=Helicobacter sp. 15-1451 TaxID=2004995 RepID=UPI000DCE8CFC|nr:UDP-N-acetylmuramoyl-L-alanyl-D-glutamate--2,6-diaminopimelate ligase [Helicobacter sp. 15-1451]RAX59225.1 UDP-N-acetylmuramoyl-L-alanyl-D-glutamate--2,6-diaminopimelate ligase [Helicobacter sp. 15-1451]
MKIPVSAQKFQYISDDSREIDSDGAFLLTHHSSSFLEEAKKKGCQVFLTPLELQQYLDVNMPIIGITGTNGKTTTAAAIYTILIELGFRVALLGTRGFFVNLQQIKEKSLTTPMLLELYSHIAFAKKEKCNFFVMEVSSHAIVQQRIDGLEFALKILTNITSDHLDFHKNLEHYVATKNAFFSDDSPKLINSDEQKAVYQSMQSRTYGIESNATYRACAYSLKDGISAQIQYGHKSYSLFSVLHGRHNLYNLLAAVSAVHILTQKPLEQILETFEVFGGVCGRMECVSQKPLVIVDFAHTEDGMRQVFESFLHQKIVVIFGAGGDRDPSKRPRMGAVAERYATKIYLTSDNPRSEDPQKIIQDILSGIHNISKCNIEPNRPLAIKKALENLCDDEVLLILGKGDEEYQLVGEQKIPMNDAILVKKYLSSQG